MTDVPAPTRSAATPGEIDPLTVVLGALAAQAAVRPDEIDIDKPLPAIPGIESVKALRAITAMEDECGVVIPDDFLFETSTVREFADFIGTLTRARSGSDSAG